MGLSNARSLMESLKKSVETLAEVLDLNVPILEEEEDLADGASDGKGIELWSKNENGGDENLGPFDDEETRSFYCDVPDLLSMKPPALLGINSVDLERQKERNLRQYGDGGAEEEAEEASGDLAMVDEDGEEDDDAAAAEEEDESKDVEMEEGDDGEKDEKGKTNKTLSEYSFVSWLFFL